MATLGVARSMSIDADRSTTRLGHRQIIRHLDLDAASSTRTGHEYTHNGAVVTLDGVIAM